MEVLETQRLKVRVMKVKTAIASTEKSAALKVTGRRQQMYQLERRPVGTCAHLNRYLTKPAVEVT